VANRNILDAASVIPYNTINIVISLIIYLLSSLIMLFVVDDLSPIISLSISFVVAACFLGILTYFSIRKIYYLSNRGIANNLFVSILVNGVLGIIVFLVKPALSSNFYFLILLELFTVLFYIYLLWILKIKWIRRFFDILNFGGVKIN